MNRSWWKEAVVYQIYPKSFNDSDGDGVGDLRGIIEKLDYLADLGIDLVWLNPVYESPGADNGYDVSDYRAIDPQYGTMEDWEELLAGLHARDIRLVMDLVVNHTSDEHEWFEASRDPESPYHDYYFWCEGDPDEPPNGWRSFFGGPAWTYDQEVGKWYLHLFDEKQPDLNWENPAVREEVYDMMRFWFEKGIDGFRMDVINLISKPEGLLDRDGAGGHGTQQAVNGPRLHEYLREMHDRVISDYDAVTIGEMVDLSVEEAREFLGPDDTGIDTAFHFEHVQLDFGAGGRWDYEEWTLEELRETLTRWQVELDGIGWNTLYMSNHDQPRHLSRFGDDGTYHRESATMLATLLHTLQGTPFVYQGEEIGMTNYPFESLDEVRDVDTIRNVEIAQERGYVAEENVMELIRRRSRDNARTPMQWDGTANAGFTEGEPWIPVNPNYTEINVSAEMATPDSIWHYYRDLIDLRRAHDVLVYGHYELLLPNHPEVWAYTRTLDPEEGAGAPRVAVLLNFFDGSPTVRLPAEVAERSAELLIGNYPDAEDSLDECRLRPYEARVYALESATHR